MASIYLHEHEHFKDLLQIIAAKTSIHPFLIEKDYWIMHCLYGLQQLDLEFDLKGGTSLSKGFGIINRFSEDIDIRITPPSGSNVKIGRNHNKQHHVESRLNFYDSLIKTIKIYGITSINRDRNFDDEKARSAGIRAHYQNKIEANPGIKEGILFEVGFDNVRPNTPRDITSWAYEYAIEQNVKICDNQAKNVSCYNPTHTLIEKLQAISTKFRKQQEEGSFPSNFLRHYYDIYCLLDQKDVQSFIGTQEYYNYKNERFRSENQDITQNEAFLLSNPDTKSIYEEQYEKTQSIYYQDRPNFNNILLRIKEYARDL